MKRFLKLTIGFAAFLICSTILLVLFTSIFTSKTFDYKIDNQRNILLLGNSHIQNSIDDTVVSNAFNVGSAGSCYYYDYVKLKYIAERNPQIDTIVLGYTPRDLSSFRDGWLTRPDKVKFNIRNLFFLMNWSDYMAWVKINPEVLIYTPQTIVHNLKMKRYGYSGLGGFNKLKRFKLDEALQRLKTGEEGSNFEVSKYQTEYLEKIYQYCEEKNIKLVLLFTPVRPEEKELYSDLQKPYKDLVSNQLKNASFVDHSDFELEDGQYADLHHTNYLGAAVFSEFLSVNGFR